LQTYIVTILFYTKLPNKQILHSTIKLWWFFNFDMILPKIRLRLIGLELSLCLSRLCSCLLLCLSALRDSSSSLGLSRTHWRLQSSYFRYICLNRCNLTCKLCKCSLHIQNSLCKLCWAWISRSLGLCTPRGLLSRSLTLLHHLLPLTTLLEKFFVSFHAPGAVLPSLSPCFNPFFTFTAKICNCRLLF
jgi:hypothetical protein